MQLSTPAARVLGCLLEKARTTPDQYPLSLNATVTACNQTTNRWPVVTYDEATVEAALDELRELGLARREKPHGGRAIKYSELVARVVPLGAPDLAVLAVLLLRGPQTPGELKARTERLHAFADLAEVEASLERLASHEDGAIVAQLPREPGRKESRWQDRWQATPAGPPDVASVTEPGLTGRVTALEARVADLEARLDGLAPGTDR